METVLILTLALTIDIVLGEPPSPLHPVVWMGKVISTLIKIGKGFSRRLQFLYGMTVALTSILIFLIPSCFLFTYLRNTNQILFIIVAGLIFKTTFSLKGLQSAARRIRDLLADEKLEKARFEIRALVGRDTSKLDKIQMVSATVESVAENICDSFFAPVFFYAIFGVPGAIVYRTINTLDAMIGHHGEFEYLGKFAARLDTVANFIPARLAALLIILASWTVRANARSAWRTMVSDSGKTESPNAGWTMSAMAGALNVQLEKIGYYKLGEKRCSLTVASIDLSLKIVTIAAGIWSLLIILLEVVYHVAA